MARFMLRWRVNPAPVILQSSNETAVKPNSTQLPARRRLKVPIRRESLRDPINPWVLFLTIISLATR